MTHLQGYWNFNKIIHKYYGIKIKAMYFLFYLIEVIYILIQMCSGLPNVCTGIGYVVVATQVCLCNVSLFTSIKSFKLYLYEYIEISYIWQDAVSGCVN